MAWRIEAQLIRGEIDNRTRGRVTGRLWLVGRDEPVQLDLAGNAWRDLAGRRLEFVNPEPTPGDLRSFAAQQSGPIGDCTASRKVKVPDIPLEQIGEYYAARKPWPWHWGNSLYLEWFSAANGRVVTESASYRLTIDPEAAWEMSAAEEEAQRHANAEALTRFMQRLGEAVQADKDAEDESAFEADAKPMTEAEAEKLQEESDRLADRINVRVEREGIEHYRRILDEELERRRRERGERPLTSEEEARRAEWIEAMNRAAEEALENPDPESKEAANRKHPLSERALELAQRLIAEPEQRGWLPQAATSEHPVAELVSSVMSAGAKLAGALDGYCWPPKIEACAGSLVRLKRARSYFDDALLAAEACAQQRLVEATWLTHVEHEVKTLAAECDDLIAELRAMLERGFD